MKQYRADVIYIVDLMSISRVTKNPVGLIDGSGGNSTGKVVKKHVQKTTIKIFCSPRDFVVIIVAVQKRLSAKNPGEEAPS